MKTYQVNDIFYSLQGEGVRAGTPNVFVRFSGCNLRCDMEPGPKSPGGFACDTEFQSGVPTPLDDLVDRIVKMAGSCRSIIFTGGEPTLQLDDALLRALSDRSFYLAIETNGSRPVPDGLDWVCVSPKVAEHAIKQKVANEVKYVRNVGQGIPKTVVKAEHYLISPAFQGEDVPRATLDWCAKLCLENPPWRLSAQLHKWWAVR